MKRSLRDDLETILLTEAQIQQRLDELARELERDYAGRELTLVAVLTGSMLFIADLLRRLPMPLRVDCIGVASYHGRTRAPGDLVTTKALQLDVRDRDVLVVDDILDTGRTLARVGRRSELERLFANVRRLREETAVIVHLDLVAGLPGEDYPGFLDTLQRLFDVLNSGAAGGWFISTWKDKILEGNFAPGFKSAHQDKDLRLALELAKELGIDLPATKLVKKRFEALIDHTRRQHRIGIEEGDDLSFRFIVEGTGGLVHHQHTRVVIQRSRDTNALALAARESDASLTHEGLQPVGLAGYEVFQL